MKVVAAILCGLALASAALEPGLIAKVCLDGDVPGETCRYPLPRTVAAALDYRWQYKARPEDSYLPSLGMFCPSNDYSICVLFDKTYNEIAGIQIALPVDGYNAVHDLSSLGFGTWTTELNGEQVTYWTSTKYFVSCETPGPSNGQILRDGLWVPDSQGNLIELPKNVANLSDDWTAQGCIPTEGTFYTYKYEADGNCESPAPWVAAYDSDGTLIGAVFLTFGTMPETPAGSRVWLESPTLEIIQGAVPIAPQCIYDLTEQYGTTAVGIMYLDDVTQVACPAA